MSGLLLRDQRLERIRTLLANGVVYPGTNINIMIKDIAAHQGAMDDAQRREFFTKLPAVLIACLGTSNVDYIEDHSASGNVRPRFQMAVYVFARNEPTATVNLKGGDIAQAIAEVIAADLQYNRPDASAEEITRFRMDNGWQAVVDKKDAGLWILSWEEAALLDPIDQEDLPDLITIRTDFEIAENGDEPQAVGNVTFDGVDDPDVEP